MTFVEALTGEQFLASIWQALRRIETTLSAGLVVPELPTPQVTVNTEPPDLSLLLQAVQAVTNLHPGPSADEIARALASVLAPQAELAPVSELVEALRLLNHRLQGLGGGVARASGGGAVTLSPNQTVGVTGSVTTASAPSRTLFDYDVRTDSQPVYLGKATYNAAATDPVWTITKSRYESATADARLMEMDTRISTAWSSRTAPSPAWAF